MGFGKGFSKSAHVETNVRDGSSIPISSFFWVAIEVGVVHGSCKAKRGGWMGGNPTVEGFYLEPAMGYQQPGHEQPSR